MVKCHPFVQSNIGFLEYEVCQFLHVTPMQLGALRKKDPAGIRFIEQHYIYRRKEEEKHHKEMERKAKSKKGGKRR